MRTKKKAKRLIVELAKRRDEVIQRAILIANKKIPEELIDLQLADLMEWVIKPHIKESYTSYNKPSDSEVRGFQKLLQKVTNKAGKYDRKKTN